MNAVSRTNSFRRGFSLVEVLLAILILALGLLGLGAVIPVIVKQQRTATDRTLGVTVTKAAEAYLRSRPEFIASSTGNTVWDNWLLNGNWSNGPQFGYLWQQPAADMDPDTGNMNIANPNIANTNVQVLMRDRLWPSESTQPYEKLDWNADPFRPQFVWDFVCRRVRSGQGNPQQLQVAVFVRRIDVNVRRPIVSNNGENQYATLLDTLLGTGGVQPNDRCVPVNVDINGVPNNRGSNGPGSRNYSTVVGLDATFDPINRKRILLDSGSGNAADMLALAGAPGQVLVDNFGNIYNVRGEDTANPPDSGIAVLVDPEVPVSVGDPANGGVPLNQKFRQVIFTPHIPGAVSVFTITRPVK